MKKKILVLLLALAAALLLVGCTQNESGFSVYADFDPAFGNVAFSAPAKSKGYVDGESVLVTVTAKPHYVVSSFTVNGKEEPLENGSCSFEIHSDCHLRAVFVGEEISIRPEFDLERGAVILSQPADGVSYRYGETVAVKIEPNDAYAVERATLNDREIKLENNFFTFVAEENSTLKVSFCDRAMTDALLSGIRGDVAFEGIRGVFDSSANQSSAGKRVYSGSLVRITEARTGVDSVYRIENGTVYLIRHNLNNEALPMQTDRDPAELINPFADCSPADFSFYGHDRYRLEKEPERVARILTGSDEPVLRLLLVEEDGVIERIEIVTAEAGSRLTGYLFDLSEQGTATIPDEFTLPYEVKPEHETLQKALEAAAAADSYTVSYFQSAVNADSFGYQIYVAPGAIYHDVPNRRHGWISHNRKAYPFSVTDNGTSFSEPLDTPLSDLKAAFTGFSPALLRYDGNGVYTLRTQDYELAKQLAPLFAEGTDQQISFSNARNLSIVLMNGVLNQVQFDYTMIGTGRTVQILLTFSAFGTTSLPIDPGTPA